MQMMIILFILSVPAALLYIKYNNNTTHTASKAVRDTPDRLAASDLYGLISANATDSVINIVMAITPAIIDDLTSTLNVISIAPNIANISKKEPESLQIEDDNLEFHLFRPCSSLDMCSQR